MNLNRLIFALVLFVVVVASNSPINAENPFSSSFVLPQNKVDYLAFATVDAKKGKNASTTNDTTKVQSATEAIVPSPEQLEVQQMSAKILGMSAIPNLDTYLELKDFQDLVDVEEISVPKNVKNKLDLLIEGWKDTHR